MERILKEKDLENSIPPQSATETPVADLLDIPQPEIGHISLQMTSEDLFGDILAETVEAPRSSASSRIESPKNEAVETVAEVESVEAYVEAFTESDPIAAESDEDLSFHTEEQSENIQVEETFAVQEDQTVEEEVPVTAAETSVSAIEAESTSVQEIHLTDEPQAEHIEEPVVYDDMQPTIMEQTVTAQPYAHQETYETEYKQPVVSMPMIAGGVGLILCFVVLAGWYFLSPGTQAEVKQPAAVTMEPASSAEPPVASQTPVPETVSQNVEQTELPAESVTESTPTVTEQTAPREDRREPARRPVAQNAAQREPRPAVAERPAQSQPRKVTVDDLINDN